MLPRQEKMGENTPFTRKRTWEPSITLQRVTTLIFKTFKFQMGYEFEWLVFEPSLYCIISLVSQWLTCQLFPSFVI